MQTLFKYRQVVYTQLQPSTNNTKGSTFRCIRADVTFVSIAVCWVAASSSALQEELNEDLEGFRILIQQEQNRIIYGVDPVAGARQQYAESFYTTLLHTLRVSLPSV